MSDIFKRNLWKENETLAMLEIIKEAHMHKLLEIKFQRNKKVYEEIEVEMKKRGFRNKNAEQIKNKYKFLKAEYFKFKRNIQNGVTSETFIYYEILDEILQSRPVANIESTDSDIKCEPVDFLKDTIIDRGETLQTVLNEVKSLQEQDEEGQSATTNFASKTYGDEYTILELEEPVEMTSLEEPSDKEQQEIDQSPQTKHKGRIYRDAKKKSYASIVSSFSKEWKKGQDDLFNKLKEQDEDFFKREEELLKQNNKDIEEILAKDRAETKNMIEMFLHSFEHKKNLLPVRPSASFRTDDSASTTTSSDIDVNLRPLLSISQPTAHLNNAQEE